MPKLVHAVFVKNEAHCINNMLDSVLPYVDESYILIDDSTTDDTQKIAEARGCKTELFTFENFAKAKNILLKWVNVNTDWLIGIAPDETVDESFWEAVYKMLPVINDSEIDVVRFPRRHWLDLEKTNEYTEKNWYPDWQGRLLRADFPRIHLVRYVHEIVHGARRAIEVKENDIHHFNLYWKARVDYSWDNMMKFYDELQVIDRKQRGTNIWPDS